jgi:Phage protein Gp138 N-terminal domain
MSTYPTPTQSPIQPDERGLQLLLKDELSRDLNCHQIGVIQAFYPATQTADININIAEVYNGKLIKYPILLSVPVIVLHGGVGAMTFPVTKGDICLLLFNDRDMDSWYTSGQVGNAPNTTRTHSLSDAVALVGLFSGKNPLSSYSMLGIEINHPSVQVNGNLHVSTGASGSFNTVDGATVTVSDGIIINISR